MPAFGSQTFGDIPAAITPTENPPEVTSLGRLGSGPRLVGRIGSAVWISASFQIFVLRMLIHFVGVTSEGDFL